MADWEILYQKLIQNPIWSFLKQFEDTITNLVQVGDDVILTTQSSTSYYRNGYPHREDLPYYESDDITIYKLYGKHHRWDGPAIINKGYSDGPRYLFGINFSEEIHKEISPKIKAVYHLLPDPDKINGISHEPDKIIIHYQSGFSLIIKDDKIIKIVNYTDKIISGLKFNNRIYTMEPKSHVNLYSLELPIEILTGQTIKTWRVEKDHILAELSDQSIIKVKNSEIVQITTGCERLSFRIKNHSTYPEFIWELRPEDKIYLKDGKLDREDGPAFTALSAGGLEEKYSDYNSMPVRIPDVLVLKVDKELWLKNNQFHSKTGPAIIRSDGIVEYWEQGEFVRSETDQGKIANYIKVDNKSLELPDINLAWPIKSSVTKTTADGGIEVLINNYLTLRYYNNKLHSPDFETPAIEISNDYAEFEYLGNKFTLPPQTKIWMSKGKISRIGGPAVTTNGLNPFIIDNKSLGGHKEIWYQEGIISRDDGPSEIFGDNRGTIWRKDGLIHREDGPAIISTTHIIKLKTPNVSIEPNTLVYAINGKFHNWYGPAYFNNHRQEWWINGVQYSEIDFNKLQAEKIINDLKQDPKWSNAPVSLWTGQNFINSSYLSENVLKINKKTYINSRTLYPSDTIQIHAILVKGEVWAQDGVLHREEGPAFIEKDGNKIVKESYYLNGKQYHDLKQWESEVIKLQLRKTNFFDNFKYENFNQGDILSYENGLVKIVSTIRTTENNNYTIIYWFNEQGHLHREDGPAIEYPEPTTSYYFLDGKQYFSQKDYEKELFKRKPEWNHLPWDKIQDFIYSQGQIWYYLEKEWYLNDGLQDKKVSAPPMIDIPTLREQISILKRDPIWSKANISWNYLTGIKQEGDLYYFTYSNGTQAIRKNGKLHCETGPATKSLSSKFYYLNDLVLSPETWAKRVAEKLLQNSNIYSDISGFLHNQTVSNAKQLGDNYFSIQLSNGEKLQLKNGELTFPFPPETKKEPFQGILWNWNSHPEVLPPPFVTKPVVTLPSELSESMIRIACQQLMSLASDKIVDFIPANEVGKNIKQLMDTEIGKNLMMLILGYGIQDKHNIIDIISKEMRIQSLSALQNMIVTSFLEALNSDTELEQEIIHNEKTRTY